MGFVSSLFLIILTMIAYAGGAVTGASKKRVDPRLIDFLIIFLLWIIAFFARVVLGDILLFLIWFAICYSLGWLLILPRVNTYSDEVVPRIESDGSWFAQLWGRWSRFANRLGNYQSRVLLMLLYCSVVLPFGLGVRLFSDPLNIQKPPSNTAWEKGRIDEATKEASRRQF